VPNEKTITKPQKLTNVTNQNLEPECKAQKKVKAGTKAVKEKGNFRKLQMKKKVMSRGYKKFNMKRYKFKSWQKNKSYRKNDNGCFKCGEADHWANACPNASAQPADEAVLEQADGHFKDFTTDQTYNICLEEPL